MSFDRNNYITKDPSIKCTQNNEERIREEVERGGGGRRVAEKIRSEVEMGGGGGNEGGVEEKGNSTERSQAEDLGYDISFEMAEYMKKHILYTSAEEAMRFVDSLDYDCKRTVLKLVKKHKDHCGYKTSQRIKLMTEYCEKAIRRQEFEELVFYSNAMHNARTRNYIRQGVSAHLPLSILSSDEFSDQMVLNHLMSRINKLKTKANIVKRDDQVLIRRIIDRVIKSDSEGLQSMLLLLGGDVETHPGPYVFVLGGKRSHRRREDLLRLFADKSTIPLVDGINEDMARKWLRKYGPIHGSYGLHAIFPGTRASPDFIKGAEGICAMRRSKHLDKLFLDGLVKVPNDYDDKKLLLLSGDVETHPGWKHNVSTGLMSVLIEHMKEGKRLTPSMLEGVTLKTHDYNRLMGLAKSMGDSRSKSMLRRMKRNEEAQKNKGKEPTTTRMSREEASKRKAEAIERHRKQQTAAVAIAAESTPDKLPDDYFKDSPNALLIACAFFDFRDQSIRFLDNKTNNWGYYTNMIRSMVMGTEENVDSFEEYGYSKFTPSRDILAVSGSLMHFTTIKDGAPKYYFNEGLIEISINVMADNTYEEVLQAIQNRRMHSLNGNILANSSYGKVLQAMLNRRMHSLNGNIRFRSHGSGVVVPVKQNSSVSRYQVIPNRPTAVEAAQKMSQADLRDEIATLMASNRNAASSDLVHQAATAIMPNGFYGMFGGPGYSGGKRIPPEDIAGFINAITNVAPIDPQDAAYRDHDYYTAVLGAKLADPILIDALSKIEPETPEGRFKRDLAITAFKARGLLPTSEVTPEELARKAEAERILSELKVPETGEESKPGIKELLTPTLSQSAANTYDVIKDVVKNPNPATAITSILSKVTEPILNDIESKTPLGSLLPDKGSVDDAIKQQLMNDIETDPGPETSSGYASVLQAKRNKVMHSINGNCPIHTEDIYIPEGVTAGVLTPAVVEGATESDSDSIDRDTAHAILEDARANAPVTVDTYISTPFYLSQQTFYPATVREDYTVLGNSQVLSCIPDVVYNPETFEFQETLTTAGVTVQYQYTPQVGTVEPVLLLESLVQMAQDNNNPKIPADLGRTFYNISGILAETITDFIAHDLRNISTQQVTLVPKCLSMLSTLANVTLSDHTPDASLFASTLPVQVNQSGVVSNLFSTKTKFLLCLDRWFMSYTELATAYFQQAFGQNTFSIDSNYHHFPFGGDQFAVARDFRWPDTKPIELDRIAFRNTALPDGPYNSLEVNYTGDGAQSAAFSRACWTDMFYLGDYKCTVILVQANAQDVGAGNFMFAGYTVINFDITGAPPAAVEYDATDFFLDGGANWHDPQYVLTEMHNYVELMGCHSDLNRAMDIIAHIRPKAALPYCKYMTLADYTDATTGEQYIEREQAETYTLADTIYYRLLIGDVPFIIQNVTADGGMTWDADWLSANPVVNLPIDMAPTIGAWVSLGFLKYTPTTVEKVYKEIDAVFWDYLSVVKAVRCTLPRTYIELYLELDTECFTNGFVSTVLRSYDSFMMQFRRLAKVSIPYTIVDTLKYSTYRQDYPALVQDAIISNARMTLGCFTSQSMILKMSNIFIPHELLPLAMPEGWSWYNIRADKKTPPHLGNLTLDGGRITSLANPNPLRDITPDTDVRVTLGITKTIIQLSGVVYTGWQNRYGAVGNFGVPVNSVRIKQNTFRGQISIIGVYRSMQWDWTSYNQLCPVRIDTDAFDRSLLVQPVVTKALFNTDSVLPYTPLLYNNSSNFVTNTERLMGLMRSAQSGEGSSMAPKLIPTEPTPEDKLPGEGSLG